MISFIATKQVNSEAFGDPRLCFPGDTVEVIKWYCKDGPTAIKVNGRETCVPFSLVVAMGAPVDLRKKLIQGV